MSRMMIGVAVGIVLYAYVWPVLQGSGLLQGSARADYQPAIANPVEVQALPAPQQAAPAPVLYAPQAEMSQEEWAASRIPVQGMTMEDGSRWVQVTEGIYPCGHPGIDVGIPDAEKEAIRVACNSQ